MSDEWRCALCTSIAGTLWQRSKDDNQLCTWCADDLARCGLFYCRKGQHKAPVAERDPHRRRRCKGCTALQRRARYEANGEKDRAQGRAWDRANRERSRERKQRWVEANRERVRAQARAWQQQNKERRRAQWRELYHRHRDAMRAHSAAWRAANPERVAAYGRQYRARRKLRILRGEA